MQAAVLMQGGLTRQAAMEHLEAQQGEAQHPYLQGKVLQRAGHKDTGSAAYHAAVQAPVRASHPSLATFELRSCFHPAKDTSMFSLTFIMPYRDMVAWCEAARAGKGKVLRIFMRFQIE
jgi:hypothetical protein